MATCAKPWTTLRAPFPRRAEIFEGQFADATRAGNYSPGEVLFAQGKASSEVFLIREGIVKLTNRTTIRREAIFGIRGAGWLLGADAAILGREHSCGAIALTKCCLSVYSRETFLSELNSGAGSRRLADNVLSQEMRASIAAQMDLRANDAQARLQRFLREFENFTRAFSGGRSPLSQVDIAQMLSMTPEHLCRILGKARRHDHVWTGAMPTYCLPDPSGAQLPAPISPE